MSSNILMPFLAYLLGSIPIGWIVARVFYKTDIRKAGSGNIGATNALRQFGTRVGLSVLALDMGKGILSVLLAKESYGHGAPMVVICGLLAILGHIFSVWLSFKGGKGVATAAGVFIALMPIPSLIAVLVFIVVVVFSRYVSLGSILAALSLLVVTLYNVFSGANPDYALLILVLLVVAIIIYRHKENIRRLRDGSEHKISFTKKGKS